MANVDFYPKQTTESLLSSFGFDIDKLTNMDGSLNKFQLRYLSRISFYFGIEESIFKIIAQEKIDNREIEKISGQLNVSKAMASMRVINSSTYALANNTIYNHSDEYLKSTTGIWLPSGAHHPRVEHEHFYGDEMTLYDMQKQGLGTAYGCDCGMRITATAITDKTLLKKHSK